MRSRYPRHRHFNPRAPQGARPRLLVDCADPALISIHALRKERDVAFHVVDAVRHISIHALRRERDYGMHIERLTASSFQSTRSAGSATR